MPHFVAISRNDSRVGWGVSTARISEALVVGVKLPVVFEAAGAVGETRSPSSKREYRISLDWRFQSVAKRNKMPSNALTDTKLKTRTAIVKERMVRSDNECNES